MDLKQAAMLRKQNCARAGNASFYDIVAANRAARRRRLA